MVNKKVLIFSDIDGTLVDCTRGMLDISEKTRYALKELKKKAYLFMVTGRPKCLIQKSIMECEPDGFVLNNGAYAEIEGKQIYHHPIKKEGVEDFISYCALTGDTYMFMNQDHCYVKSKQDKFVRDFITSMSHDPDEILREEKIDYGDFIWLKSMSEEKRVMIENHFAPFYSLNRQQETTFDCVAKGISKGQTLQHILKFIDFDYEETYCFGDGLNDIEMMKLCDHSFAMGNGRELAKQAASEVVDDVLDDGFYNTLVRYNIIEPMN